MARALWWALEISVWEGGRTIWLALSSRNIVQRERLGFSVAAGIVVGARSISDDTISCGQLPSSHCKQKINTKGQILLWPSPGESRSGVENLSNLASQQTFSIIRRKEVKCFIFSLRISKRFTCSPREQSKGCPEGIAGLSLQFLSSIKKCSTSSSTSFPKVPSALSSLANTLQSTQTLLQDTIPRAQGSALCYTDIRNNRYWPEGEKSLAFLFTPQDATRKLHALTNFLSLDHIKTCCRFSPS